MSKEITRKEVVEMIKKENKKKEKGKMKKIFERKMVYHAPKQSKAVYTISKPIEEQQEGSWFFNQAWQRERKNLFSLSSGGDFI